MARQTHRDPQLIEVQKALEAAGLNLGPKGADGWFGKYTDKALETYMEQKDIRPSGDIHRDMLAALEEIRKAPTAEHTHSASTTSSPPHGYVPLSLPGARRGMTTAELNNLAATQGTAPTAQTPEERARQQARNAVGSQPPVTPQRPAPQGMEESAVEAYRQQLLANVRSQVGKPNTYTGPDTAWCAAFNDRMRNKSAADCGVSGRILPGDIATPDNWSEYKEREHAKTQGAFHPITGGNTHGYTIKPGDTICFHDMEPGNPLAGHVATVESVDMNGMIHAIAGNGSDGKVQRQEYPITNSHIEGVIDEGKLFAQAADRQMAMQAARRTLAGHTEQGQSQGVQTGSTLPVAPAQGPRPQERILS